MIKQFFSLAAGLLASQMLMSQAKGILPLNGIRYSNEGVSSKQVSVRIDGLQLLSNRVPLNKEITVAIGQPLGFTENNKLIYAGAELSVLSPRGETLMKNPNVFLKNEAMGFDTRTVKELAVKFGITPEILRGNNTCTIVIRLYDLKGKNQFRLDFPVAITKPNEALQLAKAAVPFKSNDPSSIAMGIGVTTTGIKVSVDSNISVAPKMAYTSLNISGIQGSSLSGVLNGTEKFWVYDANMNEIKIKEILLKSVTGAMEDNIVDYTLKIPYRPKGTADKGYVVRFRWDSDDQKKMIDVVVNR